MKELAANFDAEADETIHICHIGAGYRFRKTIKEETIGVKNKLGYIHY